MLIALIASLVRDARRRAGFRMRERMAVVPVDELAQADLVRTLAGSARLPFVR